MSCSTIVLATTSSFQIFFNSLFIHHSIRRWKRREIDMSVLFCGPVEIWTVMTRGQLTGVETCKVAYSEGWPTCRGGQLHGFYRSSLARLTAFSSSLLLFGQLFILLATVMVGHEKNAGLHDRMDCFRPFLHSASSPASVKHRITQL
jgi:uncharacterized CHY-type Zn-finger protein